MITLREELAEHNEEILFADGFDDALIGVVEQFGRPPVALYNYGRCIQILMEDMTEEEAVEYFDYNVIGAYMGDNTPAFATLYR